jgi:hypothetical protein
MNESFLKRLFSTIKCNTCGQRYKVGNIRIIDNQGELWFLNAYCSSCGTKGLIVAVVEDGRATEVITDLTEADFDKFSHGEIVGVDDVLDMHNFLKEFDGDFAELFSIK